MKARHQARLLAVQLLFQRDFNPGDLTEALADFWEGRTTPDNIREFAEALVRGVESCRPELDERLRAYAEHWDLERMGAVDRNVMRLALYEMRHCEDIPPVVSINEAVDLAKEFSGLESGKFVNGILDRAARDLQRPARGGRRDPRFKGPAEGR
jgi:N utilization substance protein B